MNRLGCCERQSESLAAKKRWTTTCTQPIQKEWIGRMIHQDDYIELYNPLWPSNLNIPPPKKKFCQELSQNSASTIPFNDQKHVRRLPSFLWLQLSGNFLRVLPTSRSCKGTSTESLLFSAEEPKTKVKLDQIVMIPSISTLLSPWPQRKGPFCDSKRGWQMTVK